MPHFCDCVRDEDRLDDRPEIRPEGQCVQDLPSQDAIEPGHRGSPPSAEPLRSLYSDLAGFGRYRNSNQRSRSRASL